MVLENQLFFLVDWLFVVWKVVFFWKVVYCFGRLGLFVLEGWGYFLEGWG